VCGLAGPTKEKAKNDDAKKKVRKDDIKKDRSLLEVTQTTGTVLPGVTTGKRKKRRTKGPCSDLPSEVAPIIKHEPQVEDRNQVSQKEKDFNLAEKPGDYKDFEKKRNFVKLSLSYRTDQPVIAN